jgi:metal-responsive CopG/Arc/MetJ family transcriptional regulator
MGKVLVSMPDDLLKAIDAAVVRSGTTRSAFLQRAARNALDVPDPLAIQAAVERGRVAIERIRAFESGTLIRAERDTRDAAARRR